MKNKKILKLVSILMVAAIVTSATPSFHVSAARTVDDIQSEQQSLLEKQSELKAQIAQLESQTDVSLEYQKKLQEEIDLVEEQISTTTNGISELDSSIAELSAELARSEKEHEVTLELLKERIKALYKTGGIGTLEILLSAESFNEYSMRSELMKSMTKHDKELMEQINEYMKSTEGQRNELEKEKKAIADLKKNLESKNHELTGLEEKNTATIETLKENKMLTEESLQESYGYGDDLANEMSVLIAQMAAQEAAKATPTPTEAPTPEPTPEPTQEPEPTEAPEPGQPTPKPTAKPEPTPAPTAKPTEAPSGGGGSNSGSSISFRWPCPGYSYISAGWMGYPGHKGLDMAADYGTPIYAAESGTVMMANSSDPWGYSWGYYVSIFHNGTYSSLYAHCSSLAVSTGDYVEKGQVIGYVGSTGNSTGNHLHFEVYQNGDRVDPAQFF